MMTPVDESLKARKTLGGIFGVLAILVLALGHVLLIGLVAGSPIPDVSSVRLAVSLEGLEPEDNAALSVGDGMSIPPSREWEISCEGLCPQFSGWVYYWDEEDLPADLGDVTLVVTQGSTRYDFPVALGHSYDVYKSSLTSGVITESALPIQAHWYDETAFRSAAAGTVAALVVGAIVMLVSGFRQARSWALFFIPYALIQPLMWGWAAQFMGFGNFIFLTLAGCAVGVLLVVAMQERTPLRRVATVVVAWSVSIVVAWLLTPDIMLGVIY